MSLKKILIIVFVTSVFFAFLATSSSLASAPMFLPEGDEESLRQVTDPESPSSPTGPSGVVTLGTWRNLRPTELYLRGVSLLPDSFSVDCITEGQESKGWIVGDAGVILFYCNGVWDQAVNVQSRPTSFYDVLALEPDLGFAVGSEGALLTYRYDGGSDKWEWTKPPIPVVNKTLMSISMVPNGSGGYVGWAVGKYDDSGKGTLVYGTATPMTVNGHRTFNPVWENRTGNYPNLPNVDLYAAVHMLSPTNGWAVGGVNNSKGVIIHWDGNSWSLFQEVGTDSLRGLFMVSANDGWAAGRSGEIFHFNGTTWTQVSSPTTNFLRNISFTPDGQEGWIAGTDGTLLKYTGGNWQLYTDYRTDKFDFWGIDFASGHGWVAGYHDEKYVGGHILEYNDGLWLSVTPPTDNRLTDIAVVSDNDAWAVGLADDEMGGTIIHWDGKHWQRWLQSDPPLPNVNLYTIEMVSATEGWAAGKPPSPAEPAVLLYWDGERWAPPRYNNPINVRVNDIDMLDSNFGWMVAKDGNAVAKYDETLDYWIANPTCGGLWYELRSVSIISDTDYPLGWDAWTAGEMTNPPTGEYFLNYRDGCGGGYSWTEIQHPPLCAGDTHDDYMFRSDIHGLQLYNDDVNGNWGVAVGNYDNRGSIYLYDENTGSWTTSWCHAKDHVKLPSKFYSVDIVEESGITWIGGYNTPPTWNKKEAWIRYIDETGNYAATYYYPVNGLNIEHRPIASLEMSSDTMGWAVGDPESELSVIFQYPYPNFTLSSLPEARAVSPGDTAIYQISANSLGGFNANVNLDVFSLPSGSSYSLTPDSIDTTTVSQLNVDTSLSTPLGTYWIPVQGYAVFQSGDHEMDVYRYGYVKLTVTNHPVTEVNPLSGPAGTIVTISGTNFGPDPGVGNRSSSSHHVILAGQQMPDSSILSWSATEIRVRVPNSGTVFSDGPVMGEVKVMVNNEYSNADFDFQVENYLSNISVEETGSGYQITLTGTNFRNDPGYLSRETHLEHVSLSGSWISYSSFSSWSNDTIVFTVPLGTASGPVAVTSNGYESNSVMFYPPGTAPDNEIFIPFVMRP